MPKKAKGKAKRMKVTTAMQAMILDTEARRRNYYLGLPRRVEELEQRILELNCDKAALTEKCETLQAKLERVVCERDVSENITANLRESNARLEDDILAIRAERDGLREACVIAQGHAQNWASIAQRKSWFWRIPSFGQLIARWRKA